MVTCNDHVRSQREEVLSVSAMVDLQATLSTFGSSLSTDAQTAIESLLTTLEAGLKADLPPSYYLSAIDPGTGKTLAVSKFLKAWKASGFVPASGILVCVSRRSEIAAYLEASGLAQEDVAVLTSDPAVNALGCPEAQHDQAPIMFTTQQRIGYRARKATMAELDGFFYQGRPRVLRIWDESALLGEPLTLRVDELGSLLAPLRLTQTQYVEHLKAFCMALWSTQAGEVATVPDALASIRGSSGLSPDRRATMEILSRLAGSEVRLIDVGKGDVRLAGSARLIPKDFAPAVILDASGRVRETYNLWEDRAGGLVRLPAAANNYQALTINLWQRHAGRDRINNPAVREEVARAIAEVVQERPAEGWLIVHYRGADALVEAVRRLVSPATAQRVHSLTWGFHHGTNAFAHVPNIVIVGQNTYGQADYPATVSAAVGGGVPVLTAEEERDLRDGEYAHHLLQALCRSSVRRANSGLAGPARAYIVQSPMANIENLLERCFPGHQQRRWAPSERSAPSGQAGELVRYVNERLKADRNARITKKEVAARLAIAAPHLSRLLNRADVIDALDTMGVEQGRTYLQLPQATFGPWEEDR